MFLVTGMMVFRYPISLPGGVFLSAVLVDVRFYPRFDAHFHIHFHVHISVRNDAHIDVLVDIDVGVHTDVLSDVHNCVRSDNQYMRYSVVAKIVQEVLLSGERYTTSFHFGTAWCQIRFIHGLYQVIACGESCSRMVSWRFTKFCWVGLGWKTLILHYTNERHISPEP